jgi:hypothetical protein
MRTKKLSLAIIFLVITIIAYVAATFLCCYTTKPEVLTGEFPFSITYEYKGETNTLSGVLKCEFYGSGTINGEHNRYWSQETIYHDPIYPENPNVIDRNDELMTSLAVQEHMLAGYFMGDPLHKNYYVSHGYDGPEPYAEYYDYQNEIYLNEENREEILESVGFKIIDFTYAEPIENSFSFSGVRYEADNVTTFILIMAVYLVLCLVFVRKDKEYEYSGMDKVGVVFNFLVGIVAVPFISIVCIFFGIVESHIELINQIVYNIPPIAILCLALSVVFRRKGYSKAGFLVQFGAIPLFILILILDTVF